MTSKIDKIKRSMYPAASALIITIMGIVQILFFEKIPINDGLGYDGAIYADMVKNAGALFSFKKSSDYYAARVAPSLIVKGMLAITRTEITNRTIATGFGVFNLVLLILAAVFWGRIADEVGLRIYNKWLGFVFLFINFGLLKMTWYYPVLTDPAAFALSMLLLYAYLKRSSVGVVFCGLVGAFLWPTIVYYAVILYVFPRNIVPIKTENERLHYVVFGAVALTLLAIIVRYFWLRGMHTAGAGTQSARIETLPISIIGLLLYLYFAYSHLLKNISVRNVSFLILPKTLCKIAIIAILFFSLNAIMHHSVVKGGFGIKQVMVAIVISSILNPFIFLVAHALYFGPIVLFAIVWFKDVARAAQEYGLGMVALFAATIPLTVFSESRCCIAFFPFVAVFTMLFLERRRMRMKWSISAAVITVLSSKLWLPIGMNEDLYFMNFGPWMPEKWYWLQAALVAAIAGGMLYLRKTKKIFITE